MLLIFFESVFLDSLSLSNSSINLNNLLPASIASSLSFELTIKFSVFKLISPILFIPCPPPHNAGGAILNSK